MNEKQRLKEDLELVKKQREEKSKGHYKFLQKYYHKGAFYLVISEECVYILLSYILYVHNYHIL